MLRCPHSRQGGLRELRAEAPALQDARHVWRGLYGAGALCMIMCGDGDEVSVVDVRRIKAGGTGLEWSIMNRMASTINGTNERVNEEQMMR